MNAHIPQSTVTAVEISELAAVSKLIISASECKPIVSIVQDIALGVYRFTKPNVTITEKQAFNLLASVIRLTEIPKLGNKWSSKDIMSYILPKNTNMKMSNKYDDTDEELVIIQNGKHIQGTIDKTIYQARSKGLIHAIFNDSGANETRMFLDNTQKIICDWLVLSGFSVGVSDLIITGDTSTEVKRMINEMKVSVYDIINKIHMNTFENKSISNNSEYFEEKVNEQLNKAREQVGKLGLSKLKDSNNRLISMIKSGS